jgi:hypothetical protein
MRTLHGSDGIIATAHRFGIVHSMGMRSAAMHFYWVARKPRELPDCRVYLHFGRTISVFMNENNSTTNHLLWHKIFAGRPELTIRKEPRRDRRGTDQGRARSKAAQRSRGPHDRQAAGIPTVGLGDSDCYQIVARAEIAPLHCLVANPSMELSPPQGRIAATKSTWRPG